MLTFSLNNDGDAQFASHVWEVINKNKGYFQKFNPFTWHEAMQRTYLYVIGHRNDRYTDILPYVKKLARTIMKRKSKESTYSVFTEEGEISPVFTVLQETIGTDNLDGREPILDTFKELYLLEPQEFMKMQLIFTHDDPEEVKATKNKNSQLAEEMRRLITKHGSEYVFSTLYMFFGKLPEYTRHRETNQMKTIKVKKSNFTALQRISDKEIIRCSDGQRYGIDKTSLTMAIDPDLVAWDIIGTSSCDILKIDISPYMDYIYQQVFVEQGVHTHHIEWCDNKYKLTTPGGTDYICLDPSKFVESVRVELLLSLMNSNVGTIIAVSPESLYVKPTKVFQYDKIRVEMTHSSTKVIDLPITTHIHKAKK